MQPCGNRVEWLPNSANPRFVLTNLASVNFGVNAVELMHDDLHRHASARLLDYSRFSNTIVK
jgi:hypothetical protein